MFRSRLFAAFLFLAGFAVWTSCANKADVNAEPEKPAPPPKPRPEMDDAWEFQARVVCDWPVMPVFKVGEDEAPAADEMSVIAVLKAGADPTEALQFAAKGASFENGVRAYWVAPDEATQALAVAAKVEGITGAVAPNVVEAMSYTSSKKQKVAVAIRPIVLVVSRDRVMLHAHLPGSSWDVEHVRWELRNDLRFEAEKRGDFRLPAVIVPPPHKGFMGALACASCHRNEFKDWMMTPHSAALDTLTLIDRAEDPECISCHVVGWQQEGGYADRKVHRPLADVQCEACHLPGKVHHEKERMTPKDYVAACTVCHTTKFSFFSEPAAALKFVGHPKLKGTPEEFESVVHTRYDRREVVIAAFKDSVYMDACGKSEYVGSTACAACHTKTTEHWSGTKHKGAFDLLTPKQQADTTCLKCHSTGHGLPSGFLDQRRTPDLANVGCESCHGPGRKHIEAKTPEERKAAVFAFDAKCPTCVVQRVCLTCHDGGKRPCLDPTKENGFDLAPFLDKVRHRDK